MTEKCVPGVNDCSRPGSCHGSWSAFLSNHTNKWVWWNAPRDVSTTVSSTWNQKNKLPPIPPGARNQRLWCEYITQVNPTVKKQLIDLFETSSSTSPPSASAKPSSTVAVSTIIDTYASLGAPPDHPFWSKAWFWILVATVLIMIVMLVLEARGGAK